MAQIVDDAIGRLPENIQRELNDAWARGLSSPYTRVVDPLNATLLHRAQTIRGMQMEIAAIKAQRDELLEVLEVARNYVEATTLNASSPKTRQNYGDCLRRIDAAIAKVTGAARATEGSAT